MASVDATAGRHGNGRRQRDRRRSCDGRRQDHRARRSAAMAATERIGLPSARRIALAAQGFGRPRPAAIIGRARLGRLIDSIGLLQIDSVNVLARAHYLPAFSRLGPYPMALLDRMAWREHALFEYWAH